MKLPHKFPDKPVNIQLDAGNDGPIGVANLLNLTSYIERYRLQHSRIFKIRPGKIDSFVEAIRNEADEFYLLDPKVPEFEAHINFQTTIKGGQGKIIIINEKGHVSYDCVILTNLSLRVLYEFIEKYREVLVSQNVGEVAVNYFYKNSRSNGFSDSLLYVDINKMNKIHPELYPDVDVEKLLSAYRQAPEPILMLYGTPGVGKTSFIKYLLTVGKFEEIAYIKDPDVMNMGDMWGRLTEHQFDLIIFDDLDIGLGPRGKDHRGSSFMTQLLSYSDGVFHHHDSKIIITTNQNISEIDAALVRPGRCFDFIQLEPLSRKQALNAWVNVLNLPRHIFEDVFGTSQVITQAALMSEAFSGDATRRDYIKNGNNLYTLDQKLESLNIKVAGSKDDDKAGFGRII